MPFVKGQSGNPAGRPRGCKNKVNRDFDEELLKKGQVLTKDLFELFSMGNPTALRLVTQRMAPVSKGRPIEIDLPPLKSPADRPAAVEVINQVLREGEISAEEASGLITYVDKALGLDRPALSKAQFVALMKEMARLGSTVALMAARLDAEFGVDRIKAESTAEGGPADLGDAKEIAAICAKLNAEATLDPPAAEAPAAAEASLDRINAESSVARETGSTSGHASALNGIDEIDEINAESVNAQPDDPVIRNPDAPYEARPTPMTISEDVSTPMRELEQLHAKTAEAAHLGAVSDLAERSQRAA